MTNWSDIFANVNKKDVCKIKNFAYGDLPSGDFRKIHPEASKLVRQGVMRARKLTRKALNRRGVFDDTSV